MPATRTSSARPSTAHAESEPLGRLRTPTGLVFTRSDNGCRQSLDGNPVPTRRPSAGGPRVRYERLLQLSDTRFSTSNRLEFRSMTTLPLSAVKARLSEIADEVDRTHERVHVTRNGREYVVLVSAEDLASLEATIELLSDGPAMERLRDAERAAVAGELTTQAEMAQLMADRRTREPRGD